MIFTCYMGPADLCLCPAQVMMLSDIHQHPQLVEWRRQAEAAWKQAGHPGWQLLQDEIVSTLQVMLGCEHFGCRHFTGLFRCGSLALMQLGITLPLPARCKKYVVEPHVTIPPCFYVIFKVITCCPCDMLLCEAGQVHGSGCLTWCMPLALRALHGVMLVVVTAVVLPAGLRHQLACSSRALGINQHDGSVSWPKCRRR